MVTTIPYRIITDSPTLSLSLSSLICLSANLLLTILSLSLSQTGEKIIIMKPITRFAALPRRRLPCLLPPPITIAIIHPSEPFLHPSLSSHPSHLLCSSIFPPPPPLLTTIHSLESPAPTDTRDSSAWTIADASLLSTSRLSVPKHPLDLDLAISSLASARPLKSGRRQSTTPQQRDHPIRFRSLE